MKCSDELKQKLDEVMEMAKAEGVDLGKMIADMGEMEDSEGPEIEISMGEGEEAEAPEVDMEKEKKKKLVIMAMKKKMMKEA